jgi:hypothetical protein
VKIVRCKERHGTRSDTLRLAEYQVQRYLLRIEVTAADRTAGRDIRFTKK